MSRASKVNQLEKLERMRKQGLVGEAEYVHLKSEIMQGMGATSQQGNSGCASFFIKVIVMLILAIVGLFVYAAFIGPKEPATSKPSDRGSSSVEKEVATPISEESTEPEQIERGKTDKLDNLF